jgi:hypothetical protein
MGPRPLRKWIPSPGGKPLPRNHSPLFAPVPELPIKIGVKGMSLAVLNVLSKG